MPRVIFFQVVFDLLRETVSSHVIAHIESRRKALGISAAMALDDDAVEAEEHAAAGQRDQRLHQVVEALSLSVLPLSFQVTSDAGAEPS